ncbi:hypothetical protein M2406_004819 [Serratia sp. BIGb0163]|nr:hypothetical protein [Serratia sp. BIGb0163]
MSALFYHKIYIQSYLVVFCDDGHQAPYALRLKCGPWVTLEFSSQRF